MAAGDTRFCDKCKKTINNNNIIPVDNKKGM